MKSLPIAALLCVLLFVAVLIGCSPEPVEATPYPLETCLVSDEVIGADPDMTPYSFVHEGQEIKLCCKGCLKSFEKEPGKYLAKLRPEPETPLRE
jgi:YHS domain-containing protein